MTTEAELIVILEREIMDLATKFDADNYADAMDNAERETGFSCPVTDTFQIQWLKQRSVRWLLFFLMTGSAKKFKYEGINLEQSFAHYRTLVSDMDKEFKEAKAENAYEFAGVEQHQIFGTKIDAGFQYDPLTGEDTTYKDSNSVIINPNEYDSDS
jgi:hypothetical protein